MSSLTTAAPTDASLSVLFQPFSFGAITVNNRIIMAPLTRGRSGESRIPNDLMVEYYTQRASAGLIITEATQISEQGAGWDQSPGIHTAEQVAGWKKITEAVHRKGGKIVLQFWHTGRASHPDFQPGGVLPVAPSAIAPKGEVHTPFGKKPYVTPHALTIDEIQDVIQQYAIAARNAKDAGFDGVEVHGANGYLLDQFLRDCSNQRNDEYGGSIENRARLLLEVTEVVIKEWGSDRVGVRLSPYNPFNDMSDSNPIALFTHIAAALKPFNLAYLHIMEPLPGHFFGVDGVERAAPYMQKEFQGPIILNGGYDAQKGAAAINNKEGDAIAYGIPFISNPDLVKRFHQGAPLNEPDMATFYTHDAQGYTDYPALS